VDSQRGWWRGNAFLVAAVALPVLVVIFFLLASAIPRWTVPPPAYDLVLRVGKPYDQARPQVAVEFKINGGKLEAIARPAQKDQYVQPWSLFRFDHRTLNLEQIPVRVPDTLPADSAPQTIAVEAIAGPILDQTRAPDGYELRTDTGRGGAGIIGDLFGMRGGYDQTVTLVNRGRVIALPLPSGDQYYAPVSAIGWLADTGSRQ
jgi:hypothetical protein